MRKRITDINSDKFRKRTCILADELRSEAICEFFGVTRETVSTWHTVKKLKDRTIGAVLELCILLVREKQIKDCEKCRGK